MTGPVTALGIRDGDPAVLRALIARRGSAVMAYCERACAPPQVAEAAADAFARFRALVVAAPRPADLDPEAALLSSTRHAAADRAPRAQPPPSGAGLGRLLAGRPTADQITVVPELLIARADGTLDAEGEEQLTRLLDASAAARAAEERFRAAEHAYRSATPRPLPPDVVEHIVAAMTAVPGASGALAVPARGASAVAAVGAAGGGDVADAGGAVAVEEPADAGGGGETGAGDGDAAPLAGGEEPRAMDEATGDDASPGAVDAATAGDAAPVVRAATAEAADETAAAEREEWATQGPRANGAGGPTVEWDAPSEHAGEREALDAEVAAARLETTGEGEGEGEDDDTTGAAAARLQAASGAVDEPLAEDEPAGATAAPAVPAAPRAAVPGRGALAPAAAVVAIAAVSILATSGIFGGNEAQPPVDTGIAPKRTQVEVPEGEAGAIVAELRQAADQARRQRLAERRASAPVETAPTPPEDDAAEAPQQSAPAPAPDEGAAAPDGGERDERADDAGRDEPAAEETTTGEAPAGDAP